MNHRDCVARLLTVIFIVALVLRLASSMGDLWIDEVWSLYNIDLAVATSDWHDWAGIFFHDNTHLLNTVYMFVIGPDASPLAYRAFSIISGVLVVILAWLVGRRTSTADGVIAALLVCFSYPLINYSGEARGYMPMLAAALGAWLTAELWLERPSKGRAAVFVVLSLLGIMSHLTFFVVQGAIGLRLLLALLGRRSLISTVAQLTVLFGTQIIYLTAFGVVAMNNMVIGGVSIVPPIESLALINLAIFGIDAFDLPITINDKDMLPLGLAVALIPAAGLVLAIIKSKSREWIVPGVVVFVFPLLLLALLALSSQVGPTPRYFMVYVPFALLLCARLAAWITDFGRPGKIIAVLGIAIYILANTILSAKLFAVGRGDYSAAIGKMAAASTELSRVASYHKLRVDVLFNYHARRLRLDKILRIIPPKEDKLNPAQWYIDDGLVKGTLKARKSIASLRRSVGTNPPVIYDLFDEVPYWGLSGDPWVIYKRR